MVDYGAGLKPEHCKKGHFALDIPRDTDAYLMVVKAFQRAIEHKIIGVVDQLEALGVEISLGDVVASFTPVAPAAASTVE